MWILCMPKRDPYASVATTTVRGTRDFRRCEAGHTMCTHSYYEYRFGIRKMNYILCVINYFLVADVYLIYVAFFFFFRSFARCCSSDHRH